MSDMLSKAVMGVTQRLNLLFKYINQAGKWSLRILQRDFGADSLKSRIGVRFYWQKWCRDATLWFSEFHVCICLRLSIFRFFFLTSDIFLYLWQIKNNVWLKELLLLIGRRFNILTERGHRDVDMIRPSPYVHSVHRFLNVRHPLKGQWCVANFGSDSDTSFLWSTQGASGWVRWSGLSRLQAFF